MEIGGLAAILKKREKELFLFVCLFVCLFCFFFCLLMYVCRKCIDIGPLRCSGDSSIFRRVFITKGVIPRGYYSEVFCISKCHFSEDFYPERSLFRISEY